MKTKQIKKVLSIFLCILLTAAIALSTMGCDKNPASQNGGVSQSGGVVGTGAKQFDFTVIDENGNTTEFEVHTDKTTVGEALLELGLINGDESEFGLYVKTVNSITADYDTDGSYWAFYINGEYALSGVDTTDITEGNVYTFKIEK